MTVYVLGAGASWHAGYPLASQMAAELFAWMLRSANPDYCSAAEGLEERFGPSPNIEDVITELQGQIRTLEHGSEEDRLERVLLAHWGRSLSSALREWFRKIHEHPAPGYAAFANRIVRPGDVVITFNYDDSLERELRRAGKWDIRRGYGFPVGDGGPSPSLVLKLHGSINWMASIFGGATSGTAMVGPGLSLGFEPLIPQPDLEYLGYGAINGHQFPGGGAFPALIMPGRKKEFFFETSFGAEWTDFWDGLWAIARDALKSAEELIVCGFSLLPVDERACELILRVPDRNIPVTVVSGDQSDRIAGEFQHNGFRNVRSAPNHIFENWVNVADSREGNGSSECRGSHGGKSMKPLTVERRVRRALGKLITKDRFLLENNVNERSITHKLAEYLQAEFPSWNVDCEYNRVGTEEAVKVLHGLPSCIGTVDTDDTHARTVYPDIIVHKRGEPRNLLVIEAKKGSSPVDRKCDLEKLDAYRTQLKYEFAAAITLPDPSAGKPYAIEWR